MICNDYKLRENKLYKIDSKERLAETLGLTREYFSTDSFNNDVKYNIYKNENSRTIEAPKKKLKKIQKNIHKILSDIHFPNWVISCNKGVSYIDNARMHSNNHYIANLDIKSFYQNCKKENVFNFFYNDLCMSEEISNTMVMLVCIENKLPTGAPTSQLIAYLSYLRMFESIKHIAEINNMSISLYVDDITISSCDKIDIEIINQIIKSVKENGFEVNSKKRKYYGRNKNKKVTGVIINKNNELKVPNKLKKEVIDLFKEIKNLNLNPNNKQRLSKVRKLRGKLNVCRNIEPNIFNQIDNELSKIEKKYRKHKKL